jgi:small nuclear ribonucleoprotein (snRNP)-like protein
MSPPPRPPQEPPAGLHSLLNKSIIITLKAPLNRVVHGRLVCIDSTSNLILRQVHERRWLRPLDRDDQVVDDSELQHLVPVDRELSQCLVLGEFIHRIEIDQTVWEEEVMKEDNLIERGGGRPKDADELQPELLVR